MVYPWNSVVLDEIQMKDCFESDNLCDFRREIQIFFFFKRWCRPRKNAILFLLNCLNFPAQMHCSQSIFSQNNKECLRKFSLHLPRESSSRWNATQHLKRDGSTACGYYSNNKFALQSYGRDLSNYFLWIKHPLLLHGR